MTRRKKPYTLPTLYDSFLEERRKKMSAKNIFIIWRVLTNGENDFRIFANTTKRGREEIMKVYNHRLKIKYNFFALFNTTTPKGKREFLVFIANQYGRAFKYQAICLFEIMREMEKAVFQNYRLINVKENCHI